MCRALRIRTKLKSCFFYHTKPNLVHYFIYILDCTDQTYSTDVLIMNRIVSCSTMSVFILVTCVYSSLICNLLIALKAICKNNLWFDGFLKIIR